MRNVIVFINYHLLLIVEV